MEWQVDCVIWCIGQAVACMAGIWIGFKYGFPEGLAVYCALSALVDIRYEVSRP